MEAVRRAKLATSRRQLAGQVLTRAVRAIPRPNDLLGNTQRDGFLIVAGWSLNRNGQVSVRQVVIPRSHLESPFTNKHCHFFKTNTV